MANVEGRKVTVLRMHALIHVPNAGQFETTIDTAKTKEAFGVVEMTTVSDGVLITSSKGWEVFVPNGNIISALFENKK